MSKKENFWQEIEDDLKEKTFCGYKMALLDSDKLLRYILKKKGYPGEDLKKQLFWAGISLKSRPHLKNAFIKRGEILNAQEYQLSSFEIEDFLEAYRKVIEKVMDLEKMSLRRKAGIILENYFFLKGGILKNVLVVFLSLLLGIKFLSSTEIGKNITEKAVAIDDVLFAWFVILLLLVVTVAVLAFISFSFFDKRKKVRIKE